MGKTFTPLDDLANAVKQPLDGFDRIETEEDPKVIPLDVAQRKMTNQPCAKTTVSRRCGG